MNESSQSPLQKAWDIIRQPNNNNSQVALAIAVIVVTTLAGSLAAFLFGVTARGDGFANRIAGGLVALYAGIGAFAAGGLLGLLFGSPTWGSAPAPAATGAAPGAPADSSPRQAGIRPNTSLERIADWLTTMIVGLSLVNLRQIRDEATTLSVWLTRAITSSNSPNGTAGITIVLAFGFAGFLLVYLWSMRFLPNELRDSYDDLKAQIDDVQALNKRLLSEFKEKAVMAVPQVKLDGLKAVLEASGVELDVRSEVGERYRLARKADSEPMEDFGKQEADGFRLSAVLAEAGGGKYDVTVKLDFPQDTTATKVFWLLHNSFTPDVMSECPIKAGSDTSYTTLIDEAFWIGALVPVPGKASVRLAMNLRDIANAPPGFLGR